MKVLAVYPGRFQPFHKGHAQVYQWLQKKFGNAVIATSDKVEAPKSPFNFKEKVKMMTLAGVPSDHIKQVTNPYIAREILKDYDPDKTVLVFAVSQKDMEEDPRFSFAPLKSGKPSYLQPYKGNEKKLKPFGDPQAPKGYVIVTPTFTFDVLGKPATSASELRKQFVRLTFDKQKDFIKDLFGKYNASIHKLMDKKIGEMLGKPKTVKQLKEELNRKQFGPMLDSFVSFASDKLGLKSMPSVRYKTDDDDYNSFAAYNPSSNELSVHTMNRHPMDIFRSVAHELVHHKQNEDGRIGKDIEKEGATGSDIENEANSEAGKIMRWFAKANPDMFGQSFVTEETINEGINDPGKLKAVFLAGGPGSGKDFVMNKALAGNGLREINSDTAFEFLMKKHGLDLEMPEEERVEREIVRGRAKNVTSRKEINSLAGRLGLIVNGTADDLEKIKRVKEELEDLGYDTMMVFVNTSNEVSRQRNVERGKSGNRKVPDGTDKQGVPDDSPNIRQEKWDLAQKNIGELEKIFGKDSFTVIDNTADIRKVAPQEKERIEADFNRVRRMTMQFVQSPIKNKRGQAWTKRRARYQGTTQYAPPKAYTKVPTKPRIEMPKTIVKPSSALMDQARRLGLSYYGFGRFGRKVNGINKVLYHSKGDQLVRVQKMNENKSEMAMGIKDEMGEHGMNKKQAMKTAKDHLKTNPKYYSKLKKAGLEEDKDPCWNGYEQIGMKMKGGRKVPNCVPKNEEVSMDEKFDDYLTNTHNRDIGTTKLRKLYASMTPGQESATQDQIKPVTYVAEEKKKMKFVKKKLAQEDNNLPRFGLPFGGIGPEVTQYRPFTVTGFTGNIAGTPSLSESILSWANNPATQQKFVEKYGDLAEERLNEAATRLEQCGCGMEMPKSKKSVAKIKETWPAAPYKSTYGDMGTVASTGKEELNERGADSKGLYRPTEKGAGLTRKGAKHFGIKTAVTTPPSKLDPKGKAAKRRKSFCARMGGMKGPMKDEKGRPTRKAMSLRRWNCEE